MRIHFSLALTAAILAAAGTSPALADESPFGTLYTTDTLPAGAAEVEQWATWKSGKPHESYSRLEGRTEYEYGVTSDFQLAGYANYKWTYQRPAGGPSDSEAEFTSVSAEAIYRLWDPYTHPFGVALYLEPAIGSGLREIEAKLLLQKNFLDDRLVLAANAVLEQEWEHADADLSAAPGSPEAVAHWDKETELKFLIGASYRVASNWSAGAEFEVKREYDGLLVWDHAAAAADSYFFGPTLHYAAENYFVTLSTQAQLPWAANLSGEPGETVNGFAHEEERYRAQLRIGIHI